MKFIEIKAKINELFESIKNISVVNSEQELAAKNIKKEVGNLLENLNKDFLKEEGSIFLKNKLKSAENLVSKSLASYKKYVEDQIAFDKKTKVVDKRKDSLREENKKNLRYKN